MSDIINLALYIIVSEAVAAGLEMITGYYLCFNRGGYGRDQDGRHRDCPTSRVYRTKIGAIYLLLGINIILVVVFD